jgi:hypothetical protein
MDDSWFGVLGVCKCMCSGKPWMHDDNGELAAFYFASTYYVWFSTRASSTLQSISV